MITKALKDTLARVETWPKEQQEAAAQVLLEMEAQQTSPYRLTDEQMAEVQRRLADPDAKFLTLAEVRVRLMRLGA
jgi:hypothetical protein